MSSWLRPLVISLVIAAACADLKSAPDAAPTDGGTSSSSTSTSSSSGSSMITDAAVDPETGLLPPTPDSGVHPAAPCRPTPAACINAGSPNIIEVPSEATLDEALRSAQPLGVIQLRGGTYPNAFELPKDVSLTGCNGATIAGRMSLAGGEQAVSDIAVTGSVLIAATGTYFLQRVRFGTSLSTDQTEAPLLISTLGVAQGTEMGVHVDDSSFVGTNRGISASVSSNAGSTGVRLTVNNGVFSRVERPIEMKRVGDAYMHGTVSSSTFYGFKTAIVLTDLDPINPAFEVEASLFAKGNVAIDGAAGTGNTNFRWKYSFAWNVALPLASSASETPSLTTSVDPELVDPEHDDLRLGPTSLAVNRVPSVFVVPKTDFQGCPRPASFGADPGAFESQP